MAAPPFLPEAIWADFNTALNPLSGAKQPSKAEIRAFHRWVLDAIDALSAVTGTDPSVIGNLSARLDPVERDAKGIFAPSIRPGDRISAFVADLSGTAPGGKTPLVDVATIAEDGPVLRLVGSRTVVTRTLVPVEPGRVYEPRIRLRGRGSSGAAFNTGLWFFGADRRPVTSGDPGVQLGQFPNGLTVNDGLREVSARVSKTSTMPGVTITIPAGVFYVAAFIITGAGEAGLDVVVMDPGQDVTASVIAQESGDRARASEGQHLLALGIGSLHSVDTRSIFSTTPSNTANFTGWGFSWAPKPLDLPIDGFALYLSVPSTVASFRVLAVERLTDAFATDLPGALATDRVLANLDPRPTFARPKTQQSHFAIEEATRVQVDFGRSLAPRFGYSYIFMLQARAADGSLVFVGRLPCDATGRSPFEVGWAYDGSGNLIKLTGAIATAGEVFRRAAPTPHLPAVPHYRGQPEIIGDRTLRLDGVTRLDLNGSRALFGAFANFASATTGTGAVKNGFLLKAYAQTAYLDHANVSNVVVRDASTNALLVSEVDYHVDPSGRIYAIGNPAPADRSVNITYDWANERWDLVCEVSEQQVLAVIAGTERAQTAHEDLYRAKRASSLQRPLYWVRVVGTKIAEVIPAWDWHDTYSVLRNDEIQAQMDLARRYLGRIRRKLERGDGIILAGYGDSNTQIGGGAYVDAGSFEPNRNNANGATDLGGFTGGFYDDHPAEADFKTAFFAACATVTLNGSLRYKTGPNWTIIDMIVRDYGYTFVADRNPGPGEITYLNFGIGASTMAATTGNFGDPNRLAALCNPSAYGPQPGGYRAPDLVVIQAGMNGTPDPAFPSQVDAVVAGIQSRCQADILIYGMHLTNDEGSPANRFTLNAWRAINGQLREACLRNGVAYAPTDMIQGPGFEGYMGMSMASMCRTNYLNHPGPRERRKVGEFLASLLTGPAGAGSVGALTSASPNGPYTPYTPTVWFNNGTTSTVMTGCTIDLAYKLVGKRLRVEGVVQLPNPLPAGTANAILEVALPAGLSTKRFAAGTGREFGTGQVLGVYTAGSQSRISILSDDNTSIISAGNYVVFGFDCEIA